MIPAFFVSYERFLSSDDFVSRVDVHVHRSLLLDHIKSRSGRRLKEMFDQHYIKKLNNPASKIFFIEIDKSGLFAWLSLNQVFTADRIASHRYSIFRRCLPNPTQSLPDIEVVYCGGGHKASHRGPAIRCVRVAFIKHVPSTFWKQARMLFISSMQLDVVTWLL